MAFLSVLFLAGCNLPRSGETPIPSLSVTQAYQTVEARLTQAAAHTPTTTNLPDVTISAVAQTPALATPSATLSQATPISIPASATPSVLCDQAAPGNPIDVTIPDDTTVSPGQIFTKIWRLQNVGACTWNNKYSVAFFSGEQMGAPASVPLVGEIKPGQSVDIAVDMTAPLAAGQYQGNWKLRNATNVLFGIGPNGGAPFWVRIIVAVTPTPTSTATRPQLTPSATPTSTPVVQTSGAATLAVNSAVDLDTNQVSDGINGDLSYQTNSIGEHLLIPQGNALAAVYGQNQPSLANCQAAALATAPLTVESLTVGAYLCYRTDQGLPGRARLTQFNPDSYAVSLEIVTWATP